MDLPKISVIVPIYGVETYIERCVRALMEQTLDDIELIFVDDCSPDRSVEILLDVIKDYPQRAHQINILRHDRNMGVAAARTTGMKAMTGEYMSHCDPDDIPDPDMYSRMFASAKALDADIVTCTYLDEPNGRLAGATFSGTGMEALRTGNFTYGLWDKIIRSSIIQDNSIYPFEGINYNEDLNVIVRALCHSGRVTAIPRPLYHHTVGRDGSICSGDYRELLMRHSVPSMKKLDEWLDQFGHTTGDRRYSSRLTDPIKFWMKNALFAAGDIDLWQALWPECRRFIPKIKSLSIKERALMTIAAYSPKTIKRLLRFPSM